MRTRPILWILLGGILGFVAIAAVLTLVPRKYQFKGTVFDPSVPAADFSLIQHGGEAFQMADQVGKVVMIFFGYTHCPDVCPVTLNDFRRVEESLGEDAEEVQMVMVTVDPGRDTPEVVSDYVSRFGSNFIGLSGTEKELNEIWKGYFVYRALDKPVGESEEETLDEPGNYLVDHTARVYVIDRAGHLRLSFPFGFGAEAMLADIRQLLRE